MLQLNVQCQNSHLQKIGLGRPLQKKMVQAVEIAKREPYRAVTHNKGIMNGVDALVVATGNDFRAIEAGVHAYASRWTLYLLEQCLH